jgi:uncharacterized phage protein (TIGR01671 family)
MSDQRPLRLRAWDFGKMTEPFTLDELLDAVNTVGRGYRSWPILLSGDDRLMQSTGLTDADGCEVFDGDIVFAEFPHDSYACNVLVAHDGWGFTGRRIDAAWKHGPSPLKTYFWGAKCGRILRVVGNVFENPELIP